MNWLDWLVVFTYLIGIAVVGIYSGRDEKTSTDYILGGRAFGWIPILFSIVATETSALTFVGVPATGYTSNWTYLQLVVGAIVGRIILAFVFIPVYYKHQVFTVYQYLRDRFGTCSYMASTVLFLITRLMASGVRLYAGSIIVAYALDVQPGAAIVIVTIFAAAYTYTGGLKAVIWTDVLQGILFLGGALGCVAYIIHGVGDAGWAYAQSDEMLSKLRVFNFSWNEAEGFYFWQGLFGMTFLCLATHGTDQDLTQRMLAASDHTKSQRALVFSGLLDVPIVVMFLALGYWLKVHYHVFPDPNLPEKAKEIFPYFIVHVLPHGIGGLLVACVLAAAMSSLDSALNALGSTFALDVYCPLRRSWNRICVHDLERRGRFDEARDLEASGVAAVADESNLVRITRMAVLLFALVLTGVAILSQHVDKILFFGLEILTYTYGAMLGVFLLGLLTPWGKDRTNMIAMACGLATPWVMKSMYSSSDELWVWNIMFASLVTFAVGAILGQKPEVVEP